MTPDPDPEPDPPPAPTVTSVEATLGTHQALEGDSTTITVVVTLSDSSIITDPSGALAPAFTTSDAGIATVDDSGKVLAIGPGLAFLQIKVGSVATTKQFFVTARPITIEAALPHAAAGPAGEPLPGGTLFRLLDVRGDSVPGWFIKFEIVEGTGTVAPDSAETGGLGRAGTVWTLGSGSNRLKASAQGVTPIEISATGTVNTVAPGSLTVSGGNAQTALVAKALSQALAVRVADNNGASIPGITVSWNAAAGSLSSPQSATDGNGIARVSWTLGTTAGNQQVVASVGTLTRTFQATAQADTPTSLTISPDSITVQVGSAASFSPTLLDTYGNTTTASVTWASAATSIATVNSQGQVTGTSEGATEVTASSGALVATGRVGVVASSGGGDPVATTIEKVSGDSQSADVNTGLGSPVTVVVKDQNGSPMANVSVAWAASSGSGSPSSSSTNTNGSGIASVMWTLGATVGAQQLTATVASISPVTFSATGKAIASGVVRIAPGQNIQGIVDQHPAGTEFILESGVHRRQTVYPRDGDTFSGESRTGTILDGEDNTDYAFRWAEGSYPKNVTIRNMTIQKYAGTDQMGPILAGWHIDKPDAYNGSSGWLVENNEIRDNWFAGIRIGRDMTVRNNHVHDNGQVGVTGIGSGVVVEGNTLENNGFDHPRGADYGPGIAWKEAGVKIVGSDNVIIRNNNARNNDGMGIWVDDDVRFINIQNNQVSNNVIAGILVEKSYDAVVQDNTATGNGTSPSCSNRCGGLHGAGVFVQNSSDVEILNNTVTDNRNSITVTHQNRGGGIYGPWDTNNVYVHHNTITSPGNAKNGFNEDSGTPSKYTLDIVCFDYNRYNIPGNFNGFWWQDVGNSAKAYDWTGWRAFGQDKNGAVNGAVGTGSSGCS